MEAFWKKSRDTWDPQCGHVTRDKNAKHAACAKRVGSTSKVKQVTRHKKYARDYGVTTTAARTGGSTG